MIQIFRLTDLGGADVNPVTLPAERASRGTLRQPGLRTQDDTARGVEGGFATDVYHQADVYQPPVPQGAPLSMRVNSQPAGQGFKRSNDPADIRSAVMYDFPKTNSPGSNLNFSFETVAQGEDTMITYGAVSWGFGLRAGRVVNERINFRDTQSATFAEAQERHRDFYVPEPLTFYFAFDSDVLSATEAAKINAFRAYLLRNADVRLTLDGFADDRGGASAHNLNLSLRRAHAVAAALLDIGIAADRIYPPWNIGASSAATTDAGTGDIGGNAAVVADQTREANRQFNRRVVLTFVRTATHALAPRPRGGP